MQDKAPRKKAVNVSIDAEARAAGINLSGLLEAALTQSRKQQREKIWRQQNQAALEAYDRHIEQDGLWLDEIRTW